MPKPSSLPSPLDQTPFTVRESLALGIPYGRLRAKDLLPLGRGIRTQAGVPQNILSLARPYILLNRDSCVSHVSAASIHGIATPGSAESPPLLHLSRRAGRSLTRRDGVVSHRLKFKAADIMFVDGVPVTTPSRTFVDLGTLLHLDDLVAAGDSIISAHHRTFGEPRIAMVPVEDLRKYVEDTRNINGIRAARIALDLMMVGVDSPPETRVRLILGRSGLPEFVPNCPIGAKDRLPVWTDLGCREYRTCVEYDGGHHLTPEQQQKDARRDQRTAEAGWRQVKLNKVDLQRGETWVVSCVARALRAQGWSG